MKKLIASAFALFMAACLFAGGPANNAQTKTITGAELKAQYGANIQLEEGVVLTDDMEVTMLANRCDGTGFEICGKAEAQARHYAQQQANACCCVFTYGWECCNPNDGSLIAVLFISTPQSGQCN